MEQKKLLAVWMGLCLMFVFASCSGEDKSVFGDDFEVPELTDANTIQFTVDVNSDWKQLQVIGGGGKMAIAWGDGRLQKVANSDREIITYQYHNQKKYTVRIWAEELDFCSIGGVLISVANLRLGYLPKMKYLALNGFLTTPLLDLGLSCPNVEAVNIGNFPDLEYIHMTDCAKLKSVDIYTHPKLVSITLKNHSDLSSFRCQYNDVLTTVSLKNLPKLSQLNCYDNPQLSEIQLNDVTTISSLSVDNCSIQSMDFIDQLPALISLDCSGNQFTELDLSRHLSLYTFSCNNNKKLTRLKIAEEMKSLMRASFYSCDLDAEALNAVFDQLITIPQTGPGSGRCNIIYYDNPGESTCRKEVPVNKGWKVIPKSTNSNT